MSTILLPASRRADANLVRYDGAGIVVSSTSQFCDFTGSASPIVKIADMGLAVGDKVSASAEIMNAVEGETITIEIDGRTTSGSAIGAKTGTTVDSQAFTRATVENYTIPTGAAFLLLFLKRNSGSGSTSIRKGSINRGATAAAYEIPKRGAWAPMNHAALVRDNDQELQRYLSGAAQTTTYPSRRWLLKFGIPLLDGDELRDWMLALDQLSDLSNVFRFVPPDYEGPSTGYDGPLPLVAGASQTGTSIDCDGVTASTDIVGPGDYVSYDVTTAKSNTNAELFRIKSLCTSDSDGAVTLEFTRPVRLAPADNATIQIFAPTGQFRLTAPSAGLDLRPPRRAPAEIDAEEAIYL